LSLSAIIRFQDGGTAWKHLWTYVYKDNKLFVYENKSDYWQGYLYTIEDILYL